MAILDLNSGERALSGVSGKRAGGGERESCEGDKGEEALGISMARLEGSGPPRGSRRWPGAWTRAASTRSAPTVQRKEMTGRGGGLGRLL